MPGRSTQSLGVILHTRRAIKVVVVYLLLVAVAAYVATLGAVAGIYLMALTLPWTAILVPISDAIDPKLLDDPRVGIGIASVGVILNSAILFRLARGPRNKIVAGGGES